MRLPILARIARFTDAGVALIPLARGEMFNAALSLAAIQLVGPQYRNGITEAFEMSEMSEEQLADAGDLFTVVAWLPGWKLREAGVESMMPADKPTQETSHDSAK